jgi:uncharacterized membrane protein
LRYSVAIPKRLGRAAALLLAALLLHACGQSPPAANASSSEPSEVADAESGSLRVCNQTANLVSIALGYHADDGWRSDGWWQAEPGKCAVVFSGDMAARRYYYIYAADDVGGGAWQGEHGMCTRDETFTIFGADNCLARGYDQTGFFEVDTQNKADWTLQLTEANITTETGTDDLTGTDAVDGGDAPPGDDVPQGDETGGGDGE